MWRLSTVQGRFALSHKRPWRAWLTESARLDLEAAASAAHPKETGGILVGVHTRGSRPWIIHAVEIHSKNSGSSHYVVPAHRRRRVIERLRRKHDARLGYLGEWHSHPLDVGPSNADGDSIRAIGGDPSTGCARPLLLIARRAGDGYHLDARQLDRGSLRPLDLIAAGQLPPADAPPPKRRSLQSTVLRQ
jgi:Prokaryotic homologs of the JAB domain